jgi:hypothetical protein
MKVDIHLSFDRGSGVTREVLFDMVGDVDSVLIRECDLEDDKIYIRSVDVLGWTVPDDGSREYIAGNGVDEITVKG